jgi:hypothetical protein
LTKSGIISHAAGEEEFSCQETIPPVFGYNAPTSESAGNVSSNHNFEW